MLSALPFTAQAQRRFVSIPNVQELSGKMIARRMSLNELTQTVGLQRARTLRDRAATLAGRHAYKYIPETDEYLLTVPKGMNEDSLSSYLMAQGGFQYVEPDWTVFPVAIPNDTSYGSQWHLPQIEAPRAWDQFTGTTGVTVAVCDTGVDLSHPDLGPFVSGYNSASHLAQTSGGVVTNVHPHGTHVAGIVGAKGNNSLGVAGVNWNVTIMPIRLTNLSSGNASTSDMTEGQRWAADHGAKVITTSYSGVSSSTFQTTGAYCRARGAIYLFAAGNSNTTVNTFDWQDVTIVGASTSSDTRASFSNYGTAIDVFAPGTAILSSVPGGSYEAWDGTSMATPVAAGICAMIFQVRPNSTPEEVETYLEQGSDDIGSAGNDSTFGYGRVNLYRSLALATRAVRFYGNHYYERVTLKSNYANALSSAAALNYFGTPGHLAVINSAGENSFLASNFEGQFIRGHWIGLSRSGAVWSWANGDAYSYTNWGAGEPNNSGGVEDKGQFGFGALGAWNDANGTLIDRANGVGYMVEYPVPMLTLSGKVQDPAFVGSWSGVSVTIELRDATGALVASYPTVLNATGDWSISTPYKGPHQIAVKAWHWLTKLYASSVTLTTSNVSNLNTSPINGDIDTNDQVNLGDFDQFSAAFGSSLGDGSFNAAADLDGNNTVDLGDFDILSIGFGQSGD